MRSQPNTVETIADVNLVHVDRAKTWVGMTNPKQETIECTAKLHSLRRGQFLSVKIDPIEREVNNKPGSAPALRNATQGGEPQAPETFDMAIRENRPKTLAREVCHFVPDKIQMFIRGLMGPTV
jgi:hypothetical protein